MTIQNATKEDQNYIDSQLVNFNKSQAPFTTPYTTITKCIKHNDEAVAGILAEIYCWNAVFIDVLWVKEEHRGKGYASALMLDAEKTAIEAGCNLSHLDTFDFQAKGLYEKLGYTVFGVLEGCPEGHCRYFMSKKLA